MPSSTVGRLNMRADKIKIIKLVFAMFLLGMLTVHGALVQVPHGNSESFAAPFQYDRTAAASGMMDQDRTRPLRNHEDAVEHNVLLDLEDTDTRRVICLNALHGNVVKLRRIIRMFGLIDEHHREWIGLNTVVIILGDLVTGQVGIPNDNELLWLVAKWQRQSVHFNSQIEVVLGPTDVQRLVFASSYSYYYQGQSQDQISQVQDNKHRGIVSSGSSSEIVHADSYAKFYKYRWQNSIFPAVRHQNTIFTTLPNIINTPIQPQLLQTLNTCMHNELHHLFSANPFAFSTIPTSFPVTASLLTWQMGTAWVDCKQAKAFLHRMNAKRLVMTTGLYLSHLQQDYSPIVSRCKGTVILIDNEHASRSEIKSPFDFSTKKDRSRHSSTRYGATFNGIKSHCIALEWPNGAPNKKEPRAASCHSAKHLEFIPDYHMRIQNVDDDRESDDNSDDTGIVQQQQQPALTQDGILPFSIATTTSITTTTTTTATTTTAATSARAPRSSSLITVTLTTTTSQTQSSTTYRGVSTRARWADLVDSDDDMELYQYHAARRTTRPVATARPRVRG